MGIGIGVALLASAGIGAATSLVSAAKGRTAARRAGQKQETGIQNALNLQTEQIGKTEAEFAPFQELGTGAISPLQNLLGLGGDFDIGAFLEGTPGFQASLEGGTRAIDAGAGFRGLIDSGARAKALTRFGSDLATRTLSDERNALFRATDIGANAANVVSARRSVFAGAGSNLLTGKGVVGANTELARNSAFQTGLKGVTGAGTNVLGILSTPNLFGSGGGGSGGSGFGLGGGPR